jgi:hypothetical protein
LSASLLASGCVTAPVYHESWSAQVKTEEGTCPEIEGTFQNAGQAFEKDRHLGFKPQRLSLAHILNEGYGRSAHEAPTRLGATAYLAADDSYETIELHVADGVLHVAGTKKDGEVQSFEIPVSGTCKDSMLQVEAEWEYQLLLASAARAAYSLGRAEDGSLLVYGQSGGVLLGVIAGSAGFWVRFPRLEPETAQVTSLSP